MPDIEKFPAGTQEAIQQATQVMQQSQKALEVTEARAIQAEKLAESHRQQVLTLQKQLAETQENAYEYAKEVFSNKLTEENGRLCDELADAQRQLAVYKTAPGASALISELSSTKGELEKTAGERDMWKELAETRGNMIAQAEHRMRVAEEQGKTYYENNARYQTAAKQFQRTLQDILEGKTV